MQTNKCVIGIIWDNFNLLPPAEDIIKNVNYLNERALTRLEDGFEAHSFKTKAEMKAFVQGLTIARGCPYEILTQKELKAITKILKENQYGNKKNK